MSWQHWYASTLHCIPGLAFHNSSWGKHSWLRSRPKSCFKRTHTSSFGCQWDICLLCTSSLPFIWLLVVNAAGAAYCQRWWTAMRRSSRAAFMLELRCRNKKNYRWDGATPWSPFLCFSLTLNSRQHKTITGLPQGSRTSGIWKHIFLVNDCVEASVVLRLFMLN